MRKQLKAAANSRHHTSRRSILVSALGLAAGVSLLQGCGGASSKDASIRFTNATVDYATADFAVAGEKVVSALPNAGGTSGWVTTDAEDQSLVMYPAGSTSAKLSETRSLAEDSYTSAIAYGSLAQSLKFIYLAESNAAPESGKVKLRLLQLSNTLGALDIYVTNTDSLSGLSPNMSVSAYQGLSEFVTLSADSYRIRITASGDQSNVIYDLPAKVNLSSQIVCTLVVVPRNSGSLPNLLALPEKTSAVVLPNSLAS